MANLTTKQRNKIPARKFGLPKDRAYPMPDKAHAAAAKARASQQFNIGKLSHVELVKIDAMADKLLGDKNNS